MRTTARPLFPACHGPPCARQRRDPAAPRARLGSGEIFGGRSLINGAPAAPTARAIRPTTILKLPEPGFSELMMTHPQILEVASELTAERERQNAETLEEAAPGIDEDGLVMF